LAEEMKLKIGEKVKKKIWPSRFVKGKEEETGGYKMRLNFPQAGQRCDRPWLDYVSDSHSHYTAASAVARPARLASLSY